MIKNMYMRELVFPSANTPRLRAQLLSKWLHRRVCPLTIALTLTHDIVDSRFLLPMHTCLSPWQPESWNLGTPAFLHDLTKDFYKCVIS